MATAQEKQAQGKPPDYIGRKGMICRHEFVRLIEQALYRLGYDGVAQQLEATSGIQMQPSEATLFRKRLLAGEWQGALELLPRLLAGQAGMHDEIESEARFLILQQQYLEALEAGNTQEALQVLRSQLAPLATSAGPAAAQQLHQLAGLLLCPYNLDPPPTNPDGSVNQHELVLQRQRRSQWLGGGAAQRQMLLERLQAALPPWVLIPEGRLEVLVEQALDTQISRCPYHNTPVGPGPAGVSARAADPSLSHVVGQQPAVSLFTDYQAGIESLPSVCVQVAEAHSDEVWHCAFSHNGLRFATASKDKTVIIWSVAPISRMGRHMYSQQQQQQQPGGSDQRQEEWPLKVEHVLTGHNGPVAYVGWAPNDSLLLTISEDTIKLWDPVRGACVQTYSHHREAVTCAAWLPDSTRFVSGSVDKSICLMDVKGPELARWKRPYRIQDLAVTSDGSHLVIAASDRALHVLRLSDSREASMAESSPITSIALSLDSQYLLANLQSSVVHLWQLGPLAASTTPTTSGLASLFSPPLRPSSGDVHMTSTSAAAVTGAAPQPVVPHTIQPQHQPQPSPVVLLGGGSTTHVHPSPLPLGVGIAGSAPVSSSSGVAGSVPPAIAPPLATLSASNLGAGSSNTGAEGQQGSNEPLDQLPTAPVAEFRHAAIVGPDGRLPPGRFVLRSTFGGASESFVVVGSEDGQVAIWHRGSGAMLLQLGGHTATVNAVAWNPAQPAMLASVSDDRSVRVWLSPQSVQGPGVRQLGRQ